MKTLDPTILFIAPNAPVQLPSPRYRILLRAHATWASLLYIGTHSSFHNILHLYLLQLPQNLASASLPPHIFLLTTLPAHHEGSSTQRRELALATQLGEYAPGAQSPSFQRLSKALACKEVQIVP